MIIIQNSNHLVTLKENVCPVPLNRFLIELLDMLESEVTFEERENHLLCNPLILCERGDKLLTLIESSPFGYEYVEQLDLKGIEVYRVGVLLDNDWLAQYFIQAYDLDMPTKHWLREHCKTGGDQK